MKLFRKIVPGVRSLAAMLTLAAAGISLAQTDVTTSRINGTVADATGAGLPGVSVEGKNLETGLTVTAVTSSDGGYRLLNLPTGRYSVTAKLQGFKTDVRPEVRLLLGSTPTVDFVLQVSGVAESVTVTSEIPVVEVGNTSASTTIQTEQVKALPLNGRNFTDLVLLTPTARKDTEGRGTLVISGQRGINSNVAVDGADFNNPFFGGTVGAAEGRAPLAISQESIKEINVITNGASVEFGRTGGGVVSVITKSGTNQLHGSAFYYWQPQALIPKFADGTNPADQSKKQFGASLGGPILKDRVFFFGSYERLKQDVAVPVSTSVADPDIAAKYPAIASAPQFTQDITNPIIFGRLDVQAAESHRLTLRGNYTTFDGLNGTFSPTTRTRASQNTGNEGLFTRSFVAQYSGQFGSSILNDLTGNYLNEDTPRADLGLNLPEVRVGSFTFGEYFALPINSKVERKQVTDTLTYLVQNHVAKIGVDYNDTSVSQIFKGGWRGIFFFSNKADLLAGRWNQYSQFGGLGGLSADEAGTASFGQKELAFFAQDQWFVRPNLTVTAGVRYERLNNPDFGVLNPKDIVTDGTCPAALKNGCFRATAQIPDDNSQWSPRLGISWSPNPQSVLRVAVGRYYSRTPAILWASLLTTNGYRANNYIVTAPLVSGTLQDPTNPNCKNSAGKSCYDPTAAQYVGWGANFNPVGVARVPTSVIAYPSGPSLGVNSIDPDFKNPRTDRLTLDFDRELTGQTAVGMNFTWAKGNQLQRLTDINLQYDHNADGSIKLSPTNGQPVYSSTRPYPYYGRITTSKSDGQSKFLALTVSAQKRFSAHFGLFAFLTWSEDEDDDSNERNFSGIQAEDVNNLNGTYGYSNRDQKWKTGLNGVWDTPLWGIGLSGSLALATGSPYNPTTGNDANGDTVTTGDRPTINGVHLARNSFRQPSTYTVSLRLAKTVTVGPVGVQVFGECFNCTNTGNKFVTNTTYGTGQTPAGTFGVANGVGTQRVFQFGARIDL